MDIETALAKASLTRVEQRDPHNLFHKMKPSQLRSPDAVVPLERLLRGRAGRPPSKTSS